MASDNQASGGAASDNAASDGAGVSEIFDSEAWSPVAGFETLTDISYHRAKAHGTVRIAFNRPEVRNAFRPHTVDELYRCLDHARMSTDVGCVLLTGNGPSPKDGGWAFCSGGDQRIRGKSGYQYAEGETAETVDASRAGRLHILEVQRLIRTMPKIVIAVVSGWAVGGGHSLHVTADLTLASEEFAIFKQTDTDVASFDGGFGSAYLARQVGQKRAREIFFLGRNYSAQQAFEMGMVNAVVPHDRLEVVALEWGAEINSKSPTGQRMAKFAMNLIDDGLVGQQVFAGEATRLAYMTDEAVEGRDAFLEKRDPDWSSFPLVFLTHRFSIRQSTGSRAASTSAALALLNGLVPKKPLCAESGEGWTDSTMTCLPVSINERFFRAAAPQRMNTTLCSLASTQRITSSVNVSQPWRWWLAAR